MNCRCGGVTVVQRCNWWNSKQLVMPGDGGLRWKDGMEREIERERGDPREETRGS